MSDKWLQTPLGEVLAPISRPEKVNTGTTYRLLGARWYAGGLYIKDTCDGSEIRADKVYRVERGDFVYNRLFAWKGSFAVADDTVHGCHVSNEFPCFRPDPSRVDPQYLRWYMSRETAWNEALGLSSGGTPTSRNRLKVEKLFGMVIPLPPVEEQRRIVGQIEELATGIGEAIRLRSKANEELSALGQKWLTAILPTQTRVLPLRDLIAPSSSISYGVLVPGPDLPGGIPFVRIQDLAVRNQPGRPQKHIAPEIDAQYRRTRLRGGEVLIGVVGSIGKVGIAPDGWAGANIARAVCRIVPAEAVDRDYLVAVLQSKAAQDYFRETTRTLAQPTLNVRQLEQTPVPLPPLPEQRRIVTYLGHLSARAEELTRHQQATAAELKGLMPSVLDRAFKGEL